MNSKPTLINVDGDKVLLCTKKDNKTLAQYLHQFKYADFNGRARRSEYWWFELAYLLSLIFLGAIGEILTSPSFQNYVLGTLATIIVLGSILPMLAVSVRRLHDIDKSGWNILWFIIPIVGFILRIIWFCSRGTVGDNRFGPDPLAQTTGEIGL